jgi:hypothetical protein
VARVRCCEACDAGKDLIRGSAPDKGLGTFIVDVERLLEFAGGGDGAEARIRGPELTARFLFPKWGGILKRNTKNSEATPIDYWVFADRIYKKRTYLEMNPTTTYYTV